MTAVAEVEAPFQYIPKPGGRVSKQTATECAPIIRDLHQELGHAPTAHDILARAKDGPPALHDYFTWDNTVAGHLHRLREARDLANGIMLVVHTDEGKRVEVPAFVALTVTYTDTDEEQQDGKGYYAIDVVQRDVDLEQQQLEAAAQELSWFRRKFGRLKRLAGVIDWGAFDALVDELRK